MPGPPDVIDVEVVREKPGPRPEYRSETVPPIHPLSAVLLLVVDNLWNLADWLVLDWFITIPLSFVTVAVPVFFIQRAFRKDPFIRAFAYALLLGTIAAVPTSVTGTPVGLALLAWAGIGKWSGRKPPVSGPGVLP